MQGYSMPLRETESGASGSSVKLTRSGLQTSLVLEQLSVRRTVTFHKSPSSRELRLSLSVAASYRHRPLLLPAVAPTLVQPKKVTPRRTLQMSALLKLKNGEELSRPRLYCPAAVVLKMRGRHRQVGRGVYGGGSVLEMYTSWPCPRTSPVEISVMRQLRV